MISFQIVHRFKWVEKKYVDSVFILTDSTGTQTKIKVQIKFKSTRRLLFWAQDSAVFLLSQHTMQWIQCFVVVFFLFFCFLSSLKWFSQTQNCDRIFASYTWAPHWQQCIEHDLVYRTCSIFSPLVAYCCG